MILPPVFGSYPSLSPAALSCQADNALQQMLLHHASAVLRYSSLTRRKSRLAIATIGNQRSVR